MKLCIETTNGPVVGSVTGGVQRYEGVPYAAPPVGELRWAEPQPHPGWSEPFDATRPGAPAPQRSGPGRLAGDDAHSSEDCLWLNVVTPAADDAKRPVLVWIFGGGYRWGTPALPLYDGSSFARNGVVVASINYRLGALGFASLPGMPTAGIGGLLDQIAALEWVRDNIAAFGGDSNRVTIAGESAGAFAVSTLTAMPRANRLFQSAIAQSGAAHNVLPAEYESEAARQLLVELGADDVESARAASVAQILDAQERVEARAYEFMPRVMHPFYPSITPGFLPDVPVDLMALGEGAHIRMLTGVNADETTFFGVDRMPLPTLQEILSTYLDDADALIGQYRSEYPDCSDGELAVKVMTDFMFGVPAVRMAEARNGFGGETWMYRFDWCSPGTESRGATHMLEIPFVFNNLAQPGASDLLETSHPPADLAETMHRVWIDFIHGDEPGRHIDEAWPTYSPATRQFMGFGTAASTLSDPDRFARTVWQGLR